MKPIHKRRSGFTIVELLIVIVVLAILIAIVMVAYNGIQRRAKESLIISDLSTASRQLKADQATDDGGKYPSTQSDVNGGKGLPASKGVSYQYTVDNTSFPSTFCVTASASGIDYKITESSSATPGACNGHIASGSVQTVTNLSPNPSVEANDTGWTDTRGVNSRLTAAAKEGFYGMRMAVDTVGYFPRVNAPAAAILPNTTYTMSAWARSSSQVRIAYAVNSGTLIVGNLVDSNGQWVRLSITTPATPASASTLIVSVGVPDNTALNTTIDIDGIMITEGASMPSYADGSYTNWTWNGTPNNSTSTGPNT